MPMLVGRSASQSRGWRRAKSFACRCLRRRKVADERHVAEDRELRLSAGRDHQRGGQRLFGDSFLHRRVAAPLRSVCGVGSACQSGSVQTSRPRTVVSSGWAWASPPGGRPPGRTRRNSLPKINVYPANAVATSIRSCLGKRRVDLGKDPVRQGPAPPEIDHAKTEHPIAGHLDVVDGNSWVLFLSTGSVQVCCSRRLRGRCTGRTR